MLFERKGSKKHKEWAIAKVAKLKADESCRKLKSKVCVRRLVKLSTEGLTGAATTNTCYSREIYARGMV